MTRQTPTGRSIPSVPDPDQVNQLLKLSDERALQLRLRDAAWSKGRRIGYADGYTDGYKRAGAELEQRWQEVAHPVSRGRNAVAEGWQRRVAAAESFSKIEAQKHQDQWWRTCQSRADDAEKFAAKLRKAAGTDEAGRLMYEEADQVLRSSVIDRTGAAILAARKRGEAA